jgi:hypothetical protein
MQQWKSEPVEGVTEINENSIMGCWRHVNKKKGDPMAAHDFEEIIAEQWSDQLRGDILEGGQPLEEGQRKVAALEGDVCLNLIEMALNIEYRALDLYRSMAEGSTPGQPF